MQRIVPSSKFGYQDILLSALKPHLVVAHPLHFLMFPQRQRSRKLHLSFSLLLSDFSKTNITPTWTPPARMPPNPRTPVFSFPPLLFISRHAFLTLRHAPQVPVVRFEQGIAPQLCLPRPIQPPNRQQITSVITRSSSEIREYQIKLFVS